jgi:hypothetical protein
MMDTTVGLNGEKQQQVSDSMSSTIQDGVPLVFLKESSLFGEAKPLPAQWLKHEELYTSIGNVIDSSHISGLQRVRGMWRIYLDNLEDKVTLLAQGVTIRGKTLNVLNTNPLRLDGENTVRIRIQDIPLSVDDGLITRTLILKGLDVISSTREKLRIADKLTNCETGDRLIIVKASSIKEPLNRFMTFGHFKGKVIHRGQVKKVVTCSKCLQTGHHISQCENDWKCSQCNEFGHKRNDCQLLLSENENESSSPSCASTSASDDEGDTISDTRGSEGGPLTKQDSSSASKAILKQPLPQLEPHLSTGKNEAQSRRQKKATKQTHSATSGQPLINKFVVHGLDKTNTPNKHKTGTVTRSPPTPVEQIHEGSKKVRSSATKK